MTSTDAEVLQVALSIPNDELTSFSVFYSQVILNLKTENNEDRLNAITVIQRFFSCLNHDTVNSHLLIQISMATRDLSQFSIQNISEIEKMLHTKIQESCVYNKIIEFLNQNFNVLIGITSLIKYLSPLNVDIEDVDDVLTNTISILLNTFRHCRNNENVYSQITGAVNEHAYELFKKCNELQGYYLEFLNNLKIDCNCEKQLQLLIAVLYQIFDVGTVVSNLDLKTMAQLWKGFTLLLKSYCPYLKGKFDISKGIRFFCDEITEKIFSLYDMDGKLRTVTLKILCFLLKIIVKLCENFAGNLGDSCIYLYKLILCLYQHSSYCAKFCNINVEIASEVERCLLPGIDPLIVSLINDSEFVIYFLSVDAKEENSAYNISVLLFLLETLQKLIISSSEVQFLWFESQILKFVLKFISVSCNELCYEIKIHVPCSSASLTQEVFLYDGLIMHLSGLIIGGLNCEHFFELEELLIFHLLQAPLLMKLFISDLWCVIVRYGNSDLCYEHIQYLITLFNVLHKEKIETVFVVSLIKRFCVFLSLNQQQMIMATVRNHDLFIELCNYTNVKVQTNPSIVDSSLQELTRKQNDSPSLHLMKSVTVVCSANALNEEINLWISNFIIKCWNQLSNTDFEDLSIFENSLMYLCNLPQMYCNIQLTDILLCCEKLIHSEMVFVKLYILKYFRSLAHCTVKQDDLNKFAALLGSLFKMLLKDKNVIIQQEALETFSYFSHATKYEKIIQTVTVNEPTLAETVFMYLQRQPKKLITERKFEEFLSELLQECNPKRIRQITELKDFKSEENSYEEEKPVKKTKLNFNFEEEISEIKSNVTHLLHNLSTCELDSKQKKMLNNLLTTINKFQNYL